MIPPLPTLLLLVLASVAQAQVGPQAALLPACIKSCDPAAIASVNCTNPDQYCHCVRQTGIIANITPCANEQCGNPSADMYTFTTLFGDVCSKFNISVPVVGSNSSANGTNVTFTPPTPTIVPSTGGVAKVSIMDGPATTMLLCMFIAASCFYGL